MLTWLPAGALAHLDFVNAQYFAGGAQRVVTALLGGGFVPASISSEGMRLTAGAGGNKPAAIGTLLSYLTGNYFSAVIEYKANSPSPGNNQLLTIYDSPSRDVGGFETYTWFGSGELYGGSNAFSAEGSGNADEEQVAGAPGEIIKQVAVHDNGAVAVSSDHSPLIVGGYSFPLPSMTVAYIGHIGEYPDGAFDGWVRRMTFYPAPSVLA